jgi:hypothetical protein
VPRGAGLDRLARDVDVEAVGEREPADARAAVRLMVDEALLDELADRLADRAAAGPERLGERGLAELLALRDAAIDDRLAQLAQDLLGDLGALDAGQAPPLRRHCDGTPSLPRL